jgi:hypothetical protein
VREVPEADEPETALRGLPYDVFEAILAQMPDARFRPVVTADHIAAIRAAGKTVSGRALAQHLVVSDHNREPRARRPHHAALASRSAFAAEASGPRVCIRRLSHGELARFTVPDLYLDEAQPWVWTAGRAKERARGAWRSRSPPRASPRCARCATPVGSATEGITFSKSGVWKSFQRGVPETRHRRRASV